MNKENLFVPTVVKAMIRRPRTLDVTSVENL